jgi:hypothetical protein
MFMRSFKNSSYRLVRFSEAQYFAILLTRIGVDEPRTGRAIS